MSVNPSGKGTSVLKRWHSIELVLREADLHPEMPTQPLGDSRGCSHIPGVHTLAGWELPSPSGHSSCPHSSASRTVFTQGPAPWKAGTIYRDLPLAEHMCKEDGEQGMPEGRARGQKEQPPSFPEAWQMKRVENSPRKPKDWLPFRIFLLTCWHRSAASQQRAQAWPSICGTGSGSNRSCAPSTGALSGQSWKK